MKITIIETLSFVVLACMVVKVAFVINTITIIKCGIAFVIFLHTLKVSVTW